MSQLGYLCVPSVLDSAILTFTTLYSHAHAYSIDTDRKHMISLGRAAMMQRCDKPQMSVLNE
jgi:hypothetical protein